jgi:hypothetical protein
MTGVVCSKDKERTTYASSENHSPNQFRKRSHKAAELTIFVFLITRGRLSEGVISWNATFLMQTMFKLYN